MARLFSFHASAKEIGFFSFSFCFMRIPSFLIIPALHRKQAGILAVLFQQLLMSSFLGNAAVLQKQNPVAKSEWTPDDGR